MRKIISLFQRNYETFKEQCEVASNNHVGIPSPHACRSSTW